MSKRRITVFSNTSGKNTILESEAKVWKELKKEINDAGIDTSNVEAVVRNKRVTLSLDEAELPTTEFTLFLVAKKIKSGGLFEKKQDAITDLSDDDLRKVLTHFNMDTKGISRELRKRIRGKKEFTAQEIQDILNPKPATKAVTKDEDEDDDLEELTVDEAEMLTSNALDKTADAVMETLQEDDMTFEEAEEEIRGIIAEAKARISKIIQSMKVENIQKGVDLFEGLEDEWKAIASEIKK